MGESCTLHTQVLGGRNPVTQHPAVTWTDSTIKIMVDDTQTREITTAAGRVTEKTLRGFVGGTITVNHLDRITYQGETYEVTSTPTIEYLLGTPTFKKLEMVMMT